LFSDYSNTEAFFNNAAKHSINSDKTLITVDSWINWMSDCVW